MFHTAQSNEGHGVYPCGGVWWSLDWVVTISFIPLPGIGCGTPFTTSGVSPHLSLRFGPCPAECAPRAATVGGLLHALRTTTNFAENTTFH
jgi:hypothetical protein